MHLFKVVELHKEGSGMAQPLAQHTSSLLKYCIVLETCGPRVVGTLQCQALRYQVQGKGGAAQGEGNDASQNSHYIM